MTIGTELLDNINDVALSSSEKECAYYSNIFSIGARTAKEKGLEEDSGTLDLLSYITSMVLQNDLPAAPFIPVMVTPKGRSMMPDDLDGASLNMLEELLAKVNDPELKARIGDLLWLQRKDYKTAVVAIDSYMASTNNLVNHWPAFIERTERALNLAAKLGVRAGHQSRVLQFIVASIDKHYHADQYWLTEKLIGLLIKYRHGDFGKYAQIAYDKACSAEAEKNWMLAESYWYVHADCMKNLNKPIRERKARIRAALTTVKDAFSRTKGDAPYYITANIILQQGIEKLRRISDTQKCVEKSHKTLLLWQQKSLSEFKETRVDLAPSLIANLVHESEQLVTGKTILDALVTLALRIPPQKISDLRKQVEENNGKYVLRHLALTSYVNDTGKVVGRGPNLHSDKDLSSG